MHAPSLIFYAPVPCLQVICKDVVVVRDLTELPPSEPEQQNLFVLSEDPLLLHLLISTASSFSISLGQCIKMDGLQLQCWGWLGTGDRVSAAYLCPCFPASVT